MAALNRIRAVKGYLSGSPNSGRIYRLVIEITDACNLRCVMCPRRTMRRKVEYMSKERFEQIISETHTDLEFVSLGGYGEPLLHPEVFEYLRICRRYEVPTGMSTNCTTLDTGVAERLLAEGPDLLILAVDSVEKESYEKVRVGADHATVMRNVKEFLSMKRGRQTRTFVVLQCIYMTETKGQVREFYRWFSGDEYDAIRIRQLTYSGLSREDASYRNRFTSCYWLWTEPMVLSDGTVVPCCQDVNGELALGNVARQPLSEMWAGGRIKELREIHASGRRASIPVCSRCNMFQPGRFLALGASFLDTDAVNRWVPAIESLLSSVRYR